ncbi:hypothetical protein ACTMU2_00070 [Cupriavidus basilensis]
MNNGVFRYKADARHPESTGRALSTSPRATLAGVLAGGQTALPAGGGAGRTRPRSTAMPARCARGWKA